jgi:hypothetical protein
LLLVLTSGGDGNILSFTRQYRFAELGKFMKNQAGRKMDRSRRDKGIRLFNRSVALLRMIECERGPILTRGLVSNYITLWQDVKRFTDDPEFDRSVPGIDFFSRSRHYPVRELMNKAYLLHSYLQDYLSCNYPELAPRIWPMSQAQEQLEQEKLQWESLEKERDSLRAYNQSLKNDLLQLQQRNRQLHDMLKSLETPSSFDVSEEVLNKLAPLEQTRLLEVVSAYCVNAWTPAAAVCGMILEGRLQTLCRKHEIPLGGVGIGKMIRLLGEKGLLKDYYTNLAKVGEFFRHRAAHPTSEKFDREKTTLVLTSLILLIRDIS